MRLGHNLPPAYDVDAFEAIKVEAMTWADAGADFLRMPDDLDDANAFALAEYLEGVAAMISKVEAARKAAKDPHQAAGRSVDDAYKPLVEGLEELRVALRDGRLTDYLVRKSAAEHDADASLNLERELSELNRAAASCDRAGDTIGASDARRQASAVENQLLAAAREKPTARIQSPGGRTFSLRATQRARLANAAIAFQAFREDPRVAELLEKLANERLRKGAEAVPGFDVETVVSAA